MEERPSFRSASQNILYQLRQARRDFRADEQHLSGLLKRVMCIDRHLDGLSRKQELRKSHLQRIALRQSHTGVPEWKEFNTTARSRYKTDQSGCYSSRCLPKALQQQQAKIAKHDKIKSEREKSKLTRQNFFEKKREQAAKIRVLKLMQVMERRNVLKRMVVDLEAEEATGLERLEQSICRHDNMREQISVLLNK